MKKLNGYYYCITYSDGDHELYSIAVFTREEIAKIAHKAGARVYLV